MSDSPCTGQAIPQNVRECGAVTHEFPESKLTSAKQVTRIEEIEVHPVIDIPSGFQHYESLRVADEDAPEEAKGQDAVKALGAGVLLVSPQADEWHFRQFE